MERTTNEVRREIRKVRHKGERPIYWVMFAINSIIWLGIIIVTIVVDNMDDFSEVVEDTDIADLLEGLDKGFAFLMIAYIIVLFLCVLYQAYAKELSYSVKVTNKNFPEIYEKAWSLPDCWV